MRKSSVIISIVSVVITLGSAVTLPVLIPVHQVPFPEQLAVRLVTVGAMSALILAIQPWRVAIRGTRGDVSVSLAIDVAAMLLLPPYLAGAGSGVGTGFYHLLTTRKEGRFRLDKAIVRGLITFSSVAVGGWVFRVMRPGTGPIVFSEDWLAIGVGIGVRLVGRALGYPLGMAGFRPEPVAEQIRDEWSRLPMVPFLLTTSLGGIAALVWQEQRSAIVLLFGPLAAMWSSTQEFRRLNELLATLEDKVRDRTARLAETVKALERRLAESEALHTVDRAMVQAMNPDEVLSVIARESARVTGGDTALVTLLSDNNQQQFVRAAFGAAMEGYIGVELPIEGSLTGQVITTGEAGVSLDPPSDPRLNQDMVRSGHWQAVVEAPLRAKDRILGVLVVASSVKGTVFDEQHMRLLTLLANTAGLVLENARLYTKSREVAVLEERNRLARELHDSVTQVLFSLTLNLEAVAGLMDRKPERAAALVSRSQEMATEALAEMRSLIFELRPAALQEKGLAMALSNHVNLFRRRQGIDVSLTLDGEDRLPAEFEFCLYRVAQEALQNVAKHAKAKQVSVRYSTRGGWATLKVVDDGVGFDPSVGPGGQSFGMLGMRERLAALDGTLTVTSAPGQGTSIEARIPLCAGGGDT